MNFFNATREYANHIANNTPLGWLWRVCDYIDFAERVRCAINAGFFAFLQDMREEHR